VPSSWRSVRTLDDELREQGVVGISGIDTRALTRHLRERGTMRVGISSAETDPASLLRRVQASASMTGADGVFFSNGPGDPAATEGQVDLLRGVLDAGIPYFGICFGNQLFGRALGFGTFKLKYGHRGINQPVMDRTTGKVEVTAHNHGFAIQWPGAPPFAPTTTPHGEATVSHVCLNDDVVEGLELRRDGRLAAFSVQYHPEAAAGPHDAAYLFDRFADLMAAGQADPAGGEH
jgi:carbamoyl-phosphate synthase small subunit